MIILETERLLLREMDRNDVEIGYLFLRKYWGQGLATEAAKACRDYGINRLGYMRLISLIDPNNVASKRVAEKIGMAFEKKTFMFNKQICVYAFHATASEHSTTSS